MSGVLVTSATSAGGVELCRALAARHDVVLASGPEPIAAGARLMDAGARRYVQADLSHSRTRRSLLFGLALDLGIDTVVHAPQGRAAHRHAEADTVRDLLHLCERHPTIRAFIYRGTGEVYRVRAHDPALIDEDHPLETGEFAPPALRDLVEADQAACAHAGLSRLRIAVLRCAELYAEGACGPLVTWLRKGPCLRPLGFDPMVGLVSLNDLARAVVLAVESAPAGVFNVPGADVLPLSELAERTGRLCVAAPGFLLAPVYALWPGTPFRYGSHRRRLHFGAVLCGERAAAAFGYAPREGIGWPREPWPHLPTHAPV